MTIRSYQKIYPSIDKSCYIDESAIVIGKVECGKDVSIWPLVVARGDVNYIQIGHRSNIQDGAVLHVSRISSKNPQGFPLIIGSDVTVGHQCMLHGCVLGNRILVGMGAIVMDGAIVQDDVIIGAGSVVPPNKTLASGYVYVGNPVKQVRPLSQDERDFLSVSANNYVVLKNEYLLDTQENDSGS
jgi:carbonic anhydrase/acetyltransferase-like protein (isoleucine patch superfamily)